MNNLRLTFIIGFLSLSLQTQAQLETRWWYFGEKAGLDFISGIALADTHSAQLGHGMGCAVQSDSAGNLMFYFLRDTVWNGQHQAMPSSVDFLPSLSEQNSVIVPYPNHVNRYFLFTVGGANAFNGVSVTNFTYHLIDMSLENGLGDVVDTVKNVFICDSNAEKIAATPHANGIDYWVMIQQCGSDLYHAYLVTENGVNTTPVTSQMGIVASNYGMCEGTLRFNHAGNMLACLKGQNLEIFDFNASTGQLSNPRILQNTQTSFGLEFSADDTKLYTGGPVQYDVTLPTAAAIEASEVLMAYGRMVGLQYALDGRIYGCSFYGTQTGYMGVINYPNEAGLACGYQDSVVYLEGRYGAESLPNFLSTYFKTSFFADSACVGVPLEFEINFHFITNVQWNFGDPSSGSANLSTLVNPTHEYSSAGNYTVTLIAQNGIKSDTVVKTITVKDVPQIDLGPDRDLCLTNPDSVKLSLGGEKGVYQWSTGSVDSLVHITTTLVSSSTSTPLGINLTFTNECGTDRDTVLVYGSKPLTLSLVADTSVCDDVFMVVPAIDTLTSIVKMLWQDSSINATFTTIRESEIEQTQTIKLTATNACGSASDSMRITFLSVPDGLLPNDSIHCLDEGFYLVRPNTIGITYEWENGSQDFQRYVSGTGTYGLTSYNQCDTLRDTFSVVFNGEPKAEFVDDTLFCPNETFVLSNLQHQVGQTYVWSNGSTDSVLVFTSDSAFGGIISVRITLKQCSVIDSILLELRGDCYDACVPSFANVFTPNGDGLNEQFRSGLEDCQLESYQFTVYNRWGQTVFSSTNPKLGWDGSMNGQLASEGVYFYTLDFKTQNQGEMHYQGAVEVIR